MMSPETMDLEDVDDIDNDMLVESNKCMDTVTRKKKFIFRLVLALHHAGNVSYKTEEYGRLVAHTFGLHASISVFPVTAMITFHESNLLHPSSSESYSIRINGGWYFKRLSLLDQLCYEICKCHLPFEEADEKLTWVEEKTPGFEWYVICAAFGTVSFAATTLFFGGTWIDGLWAMLYGIIVYFLGTLCERFHGLAEIECFFSSFVVSLLSSLLDKFVFDNKLCQFGQLFGGVVWLLPGITITIAILEIYSRMIVYGSSRLIYGISLALQLGLGLTAGYKVVFGGNDLPESFQSGCRNPIAPEYGFILLPLASASLGIIINADFAQLPGMILSAGAGQFASYGMTVYKSSIGEDAIPVLAAVVVTITSRLYAYYMRERPLVYIISGLLVLVPGGVGVRGMSQMWSGNAQEGLEFTFKMLMIGVSLAIGVFIALIPRRKWLLPRRPRRLMSQAIEDYDSVKTQLLRDSLNSSGGVSLREVV